MDYGKLGDWLLNSLNVLAEIGNWLTTTSLKGYGINFTPIELLGLSGLIFIIGVKAVKMFF